MRTLEGEYWVDLEGSNKVKISNLGRFRRGNKLLKTQFDKDGYIMFSVGGELKRVYAHRIIAKYFCENDNPEIRTVVDHINGDKQDNRADNLRWTTIAENTKAAYELGLIKKGKKGSIVIKNIETGIVKVFDTLTRASQWGHLDPNQLEQVTRGVRKTHRGHIAYRVDEELNDGIYTITIESQNDKLKKTDFRKVVLDYLTNVK